MHPVRNLKLATALGPAGMLSLGRAALELAIARLKFGRYDVHHLIGTPRTEPAISSSQPLTEADLRLVERIRYAIPRVGSRLPWRADCLIQALAAKRWLDRHALSSSILLGVRKDDAARFEAHAWLMLGDLVITGGDISGFTPLVGSEQDAEWMGARARPR